MSAPTPERNTSASAYLQAHARPPGPLKAAAARLGTRLVEDHLVVRGSRPSVGAPTTRGTWARISWHAPSRVFSREFSGLEASMAVLGVPNPSFIQAVHWMSGGLVCRAEEMTLVHEPTVSTGYTLNKAPRLTEQWREDLSATLERLARTDTDRVSLVQEDIDCSIREAFGASIDTTVSDWVVGHGDLHWDNLTAPRLFLLDWDSWGLMPRGLDAAKLWESAFRVPDFAEEITERLALDLMCRDGKLSRLWVCANRILGARRRGRATDQTEHARRVGRSLLAELS